jgi:chromosomal replication initiator protein
LRRQAQREAFERQMLNAAAGVDVLPYIDRGWPPYAPAAPYDECAVSPPRRRPITMREIIREVAQKHGVLVADILSDRRHKPVVVARHEAMWRCKNETSFSLPQIGRAIGNRDHTTVMHGIKMHEQRMRDGA